MIIKKNSEKYQNWLDTLPPEQNVEVIKADKLIQQIQKKSFTLDDQQYPVPETLINCLERIVPDENATKVAKWSLKYFRNQLKYFLVAPSPLTSVATSIEELWQTLSADKRKAVVQKHLLQFYAQMPVKRNQPIVLFSQVFPDGLGDWTHLKNVAETLICSSEEYQVDVIGLFPYNRLEAIKKLPIAPHPRCTVHSQTYYHSNFAGGQVPINGEIQFSPQMQAALNNAALFMEISSSSLSVDKFTKCLTKAKYHYLSEYGLSFGHEDALENNIFRSGLRLNTGVFFSKQLEEFCNIPKSTSMKIALEDLSTDLRALIFNEDTIEEYFAEFQLFLGYFTNVFTAKAFVYTMAKYSQEEIQNIDVVVNFNEEMFHALDENFLKDMGISRCEYVYLNQGNVTTILSRWNHAKGKTLRILNIFPILQKDFFNLMVLSHPIKGCTGDCTISETLSLNALPFYELRSFKKQFFEEFTDLIKTRITNSEILLEYYEVLSKLTLLSSRGFEGTIFSDCQILGTLLRNPQLWEAHDQFISLIKKEYRLNELIQGIVKRTLVHQENPAMASLEMKVLKLSEDDCESFAIVREKIQAIMKYDK